VLLNLVRPTEGWTADRIRKMYGSSEVDIQFPTTIPVNLTYQTAFVDDEGKLQIRRDIYGYDGRMQSAIKSERGMIEMAQERPKESGSGSSGSNKRPRTADLPPRATGGGFFEQLFGTRTSQQQVRPTSRVR
jgi:L,D-transpeptidase YcbB